MNQELLSVGSKRRRTGGSVRGNASSSQADEEQMNRVEEEEEEQPHSRQQGEEHVVANGEVDGPGSVERSDLPQEHLEENNNSCIVADHECGGQPEDSEQQEEEDEDEEHVCDMEDEDEEEMDQDSDDFDQSDDSSREDEHRNSSNIPNSNSIMDISVQQKPNPFQMKTKVAPSCTEAIHLPNLITLPLQSTARRKDTIQAFFFLFVLCVFELALIGGLLFVLCSGPCT